MRIPDDVRDRLRDLIWARADELGWAALNDAERARRYEQWTRESEIGGTLAHYMDARKVRVYIKDSLLKPYVRARLSGTEREILGRLGISADGEVALRYIKPHGIAFADGKIVGWGNSRDWKLVLMAMFERSALRPGSSPFGTVLIESGKTSDASIRKLVGDAASRLGIERMEWIE